MVTSDFVGVVLDLGLWLGGLGVGKPRPRVDSDLPMTVHLRILPAGRLSLPRSRVEPAEQAPTFLHLLAYFFFKDGKSGELSSHCKTFKSGSDMRSSLSIASSASPPLIEVLMFRRRLRGFRRLRLVMERLVLSDKAGLNGGRSFMLLVSEVKGLSISTSLHRNKRDENNNRGSAPNNVCESSMRMQTQVTRHFIEVYWHPRSISEERAPPQLPEKSLPDTWRYSGPSICMQRRAGSSIFK